MNSLKIISPCISICKNDPGTGYCYGCARTEDEKKIWKNPDTNNEWKKEKLNTIMPVSYTHLTMPTICSV